MLLKSDLRPVGKGRPRFAGGHAFTPQRTRDFEKELRAEWTAAGNTETMTGTVALQCEFRFACPVSWSMRRTRAALQGKEFPGKPDIDNLVKAVMDALNGLAWVDDKQVAYISAVKMYAQEDGLTVRVDGIQLDE